MNVFGVELATLLLGRIKYTRQFLFSLLLINILSISLFFNHNYSNLVAHVVQHDTAIATDTLRNYSLSTAKYLFIVRSEHNNLELRNAIRKLWYKDGTDTHTSFRSSIDAKLQFVIEDLPHTTNKHRMQDLQFNDTLWIQSSGPRSIESVRFLEVVPTAHYYIISLDTTFVNFENVAHFLQGQGKVFD